MSSVALSPVFGSPKAIAELTGLSHRTVRRLYTSGELNSHMVGRRVLIDYQDAVTLVRRAPGRPPGPSASSARGPEQAEDRERISRALAALGDAGDGRDDAEQVEAWDQLRAGLAADRGEG